MAANTVLTTVKINADTSQAKSQIQDMFSSLSKIANMQPDQLNPSYSSDSQPAEETNQAEMPEVL